MKPLILNATDNNGQFESSFVWKTTGISKKATQWFCFMIMHHTQQNWSRKRLRHLVGKYFHMRLTRLDSVRLPLIYVDGTRTCSAALHFLRRCTKMTRWLVWLKRATIFLAWHPQIVKQVEKMYSYQWTIFRIKYFLSLSCNKICIFYKKIPVSYLHT